jgi:hypothetical protein
VPAWVDDLLGIWSGTDRAEISRASGYPSASPAFSTDSGSDEIDATGYSAAELRAVAAAVDWLHLAHPKHYRALARRWRPWLRAGLNAHRDEARLADEASQMIADYIDQVLG